MEQYRVYHDPIKCAHKIGENVFSEEETSKWRPLIIQCPNEKIERSWTVCITNGQNVWQCLRISFCVLYAYEKQVHWNES